MGRGRSGASPHSAPRIIVNLHEHPEFVVREDAARLFDPAVIDVGQRDALDGVLCNDFVTPSGLEDPERGVADVHERRARVAVAAHARYFPSCDRFEHVADMLSLHGAEHHGPISGFQIRSQWRRS
jgi:hypothetical protein